MYTASFQSLSTRPLPQSAAINKLGVIVHWGPYSVPAYDSDASGRKIKNGSEWYYQRLVSGPFRPPGGREETQAFHHQNFGKQHYTDFADSFLAEKFDPKEWVTLFKKCGVQYVIITAKHHDGFCMWPFPRSYNKSAKDRNFNEPKSLAWDCGSRGPKRDLIDELCNEVRRQGLQFGIYYSFLEHNESSHLSKKYIKDVMLPQLNDLNARYRPDIWWFDGDWCNSSEELGILKFVADLYNRDPNVIVNDRLGTDKPTICGDISNFHDRYMPNKFVARPWENVYTLGDSWGYRKDDVYKSVEQIVEDFTMTVTRGGRFLVNIGPMSDGTIPKEQIERLEAIGSHTKKNKIV